MFFFGDAVALLRGSYMFLWIHSHVSCSYLTKLMFLELDVSVYSFFWWFWHHDSNVVVYVQVITIILSKVYRFIESCHVFFYRFSLFSSGCSFSCLSQFATPASRQKSEQQKNIISVLSAMRNTRVV